jgi:hypothetical protein
MRRILPLAIVMFAGCAVFEGPAHRRPGSNIALPSHASVAASLLQSIACAALRRDSAAASQPPRPAGGVEAKQCGVLPAGDQAPAKPPLTP